MEKMEFPWLRDTVTPVPLAPAPEAELSRTRRYFKRLRPHLPKIGLAALLLGLAVAGRVSSSPDRSPARRSAEPEILVMSMVAIPKGHPIPLEALSEVSVRAGSLSKAQRLRALLPEHLSKLRYAIVAKKDIAPQTPIFWTDLMLKTGALRSPRANSKTRIYFDSSHGASL